MAGRKDFSISGNYFKKCLFVKLNNLKIVFHLFFEFARLELFLHLGLRSSPFASSVTADSDTRIGRGRRVLLLLLMMAHPIRGQIHAGLRRRATHRHFGPAAAELVAWKIDRFLNIF